MGKKTGPKSLLSGDEAAGVEAWASDAIRLHMQIDEKLEEIKELKLKLYSVRPRTCAAKLELNEQSVLNIYKRVGYRRTSIKIPPLSAILAEYNKLHGIEDEPE